MRTYLNPERRSSILIDPEGDEEEEDEDGEDDEGEDDDHGELADGTDAGSPPGSRR